MFMSDRVFVQPKMYKRLTGFSRKKPLLVQRRQWTATGRVISSSGRAAGTCTPGSVMEESHTTTSTLFSLWMLSGYNPENSPAIQFGASY